MAERVQGRGWWGHTGGASLVEFALVAPLLVVIALGGVELARAVAAYQTADSTVRVAARYLARTSDPTNADFRQYAKNLAVFGSIAQVNGKNIIPVEGSLPTGTVFTITYPVGGAQVLEFQAKVPFTSQLLALFGGSTNMTFTVKHQEPFIGE
jgi:Flp pilus assembly protein TadG